MTTPWHKSKIRILRSISTRTDDLKSGEIFEANIRFCGKIATIVVRGEGAYSLYKLAGEFEELHPLELLAMATSEEDNE